MDSGMDDAIHITPDEEVRMWLFSCHTYRQVHGCDSVQCAKHTRLLASICTLCIGLCHANSQSNKHRRSKPVFYRNITLASLYCFQRAG